MNSEVVDGPAAIVLVKQLLPDVVLVDAKLPVLNGIEAPRWIRAASLATRVIGMSIGADPKVVTAMREAGATGYVDKLQGMDSIVAAIRQGQEPMPGSW
jgi:DNA-binding NarL/FixJ family response regulator